MKKILGEKIGMTRIFDKNNKAIAVSVISVPENKILCIKSKEADGYDAIQIGYGTKKHITKPLKNHLKKSDTESIKNCREFRINPDEVKDYELSKNIDLGDLKIDQKIQVCGISKGKGYAGVMKRHGFKGMPASHGHEKQRIPGSIGCRFPQRVVKGKRMAGHMGVDQVTIKNLRIVDIDVDKKFIALEGAIPGAKGSLVEISYK